MNEEDNIMNSPYGYKARLQDMRDQLILDIDRHKGKYITQMEFLIKGIGDLVNEFQRHEDNDWVIYNKKNEDFR